MKTVNKTITVIYEVWTGEGDKLVSTTDYDEAHRVRRASNAAGKYAKVHTHREWPCSCGATVHSSSRDTACDRCDAQYNVYGQRLNDNWRSNMSNYDDDVSDMDGAEVAALRRDNFIDGIVLGGGL